MKPLEFENERRILPSIHETSPKRKQNNHKTVSNFSNEEKNSLIPKKMLAVSSNFYDGIREIDHQIGSIDTLLKHYYGEDTELNKKRIQKIIREENTFFTEDEAKKGGLAMKYLYYPNVGLSTSQSLMRAMTNFLRATEKNYNAPDRSKFEKRLFLKDVMRLIMFDLKPIDPLSSKKFAKDDGRIEELIKKNYDEMRRISMFVKARRKITQSDLTDFANIDLMHELRQKMIEEFKTPTKNLTPDQKEEVIIGIRDRFIPEKKKSLLESRIAKQKEIKMHEMTSKKSINNVYYQIIAMNKKDREKFKKRIALTSSTYSRFMNL